MCARAIAELEVEHGSSTSVCVVIARQAPGAPVEINASTAMYGSTEEPPAALLEFSRRLTPAIETLVRDLATERGEVFHRRLDLERALDMLDEKDGHGSGADDKGEPS
jgi:hypothetical protein